MKYFILVIIGLSAFGFIDAQTYDLYSKELYSNDKGSLPYRIMPPKNYQSDVAYPLIVFLHGSGERGDDNTLQLKHGGNFFMLDSIRDNYPAFVIFPQCKTGMSWNSVEYEVDTGREFIFPTKQLNNVHLDLVEGLIHSLTEKYNINKKKIYVGGLSMGGMGTFEIVMRNPRLFAAAFPICGGAHPNLGRRLRRTSMWIFHGSDDQVVPARYSEQIYNALKSKNADVKLTLYPGVGHDSWTNAFAEPNLMRWLFSKTN